VVSVKEKGKARLCQVSVRETNASEPLMTCRKRKDDVKTEGGRVTRDERGGNLFTAQTASGMEKA
jgi:hypothetical protein